MAERALWFAIRDRRLGGFESRRQVSVGPFVDAGRTAAIGAAGYEVMRFWNNDILGNLDGVLTVLLETLRARTLTLSSPRGRGF